MERVFVAFARELELDRALAWYFIIIFFVCARFHRAFAMKHARFHRLCGVVHVCALCARAWMPHASARARATAEDGALALSGVALTASAYVDFAKAHARARPNKASGTLHPKATVTGEEMLEHLYYQVVNAAQAGYLHACDTETFARGSFAFRCAMCALVTMPWMFRGYFPTHSFRANYDDGAKDVESMLYRLKKWQYVLYKTVLLHGLNVSMVFASGEQLALVRTPGFRTFWLCLNAAYVLEFFLQTLVKRKYIRQRTMLALNQTLMVISSYAVLPILRAVAIPAAMTCFVMCFANRKREMQNVFTAIAVVAAVREMRLALYFH